MVYAPSEDQSLALADLSLCWAHRSVCWFCCEVAHVWPTSRLIIMRILWWILHVMTFQFSQKKRTTLHQSHCHQQEIVSLCVLTGRKEKKFFPQEYHKIMNLNNNKEPCLSMFAHWEQGKEVWFQISQNGECKQEQEPCLSFFNLYGWHRCGSKKSLVPAQSESINMCSLGGIGIFFSEFQWII